MKRKHIIFLCTILILLAGILWLLWSNLTVGLTTITVTEANLPSAFDGYRIAHVSDLHNSSLWEQVIEQLKKAEPDIICITGDIVDSVRTDVDLALTFVTEAVKIAPCYFITGNHEIALSFEMYKRLINGMLDAGATVLTDEEIVLMRDGETVSLVGHHWGDSANIGNLTEYEGYKILLSHPPEDFRDYVAGEYDLVLAGHAHGGQVRLPFLGGLYAPGQGILPHYDSGLYSDGKTDMIVSRGIGNSSFPVRFNNQPEVILLILECQ